MTFTLNSNNPTASKMREEMYLKHLREVQRINNRQADQLKKSLKYYRSISELHRNNKLKANKMRNQQTQKRIEQKNNQIEKKIKEISCDDNLKQMSPTLLTVNTALTLVSNNKLESKDLSHMCFTQDLKILGLADKSPKNDHMKTLHYRYRLKQQRLIQQQNSKLYKAIQDQKSTLLPMIRKNRQFCDKSKMRQRTIQKCVSMSVCERRQSLQSQATKEESNK